MAHSIVPGQAMTVGLETSHSVQANSHSCVEKVLGMARKSAKLFLLSIGVTSKHFQAAEMLGRRDRVSSKLTHALSLLLSKMLSQAWPQVDSRCSRGECGLGSVVELQQSQQTFDGKAG